VLKVVGVDLAGSPNRVTGLCCLDSRLSCELARAKSDDEIFSFVQEMDPMLIAVDAPLSFPISGGGFRKCDRELKKMGVKPLPLTLRGMRMLTERAIKLKRVLKELGYEVIEVFPSGAQKFLNLPSKKSGDKDLRDGLLSLGIRRIPREIDIHVLDAITCAFVGLLYLKGKCIEVGDPVEGVIVMPRPHENKK